MWHLLSPLLRVVKWARLFADSVRLFRRSDQDAFSTRGVMRLKTSLLSEHPSDFCLIQLRDPFVSSPVRIHLLPIRRLWHPLLSFMWWTHCFFNQSLGKEAIKFDLMLISYRDPVPGSANYKTISVFKSDLPLSSGISSTLRFEFKVKILM